MAKSGKQRQKEFRERRKGQRQINVFIDRESSERLDRIRDELNESIADVLQRTMEFYEDSHSPDVRGRIVNEDESETVSVGYRVISEDEPEDRHARVRIKNVTMETRRNDDKKRKKLRSKKKKKPKNVRHIWE